MHQLHHPTPKQIALAQSLGLDTTDKSFRVLTAEITDALELKSFEHIERTGIKPGMAVKYTGVRDDMPHRVTVSTVARTGYLHFKRTPKYCRPWNVRPCGRTT